MAYTFDECFEHLNKLITFCHIIFKPKDAITSKEFVNFCEDTIYRVLQRLPLSCLFLHFYQMSYRDQIFGIERDEKEHTRDTSEITLSSCFSVNSQ